MSKCNKLINLGVSALFLSLIPTIIAVESTNIQAQETEGNTTIEEIAEEENNTIGQEVTVRGEVKEVEPGVSFVLQEEGFIGNYQETGEGVHKYLSIALKYQGKGRQPVIGTLKRVSRPGLRVYSKRKDIPRVLGGIGIAIVSTSHGVMTDREARRQGVGGEILCYIW